MLKGSFEILKLSEFSEPILPPPLPDPFPNSDVIRNCSRAIQVFTDGSAQPNPGPCGSGVFVRYGRQQWRLSRYVGIGSNLMAELRALQLVLENLLSPEGRVMRDDCGAWPPVVVFSDCQVAIKGVW